MSKKCYNVQQKDFMIILMAETGQQLGKEMKSSLKSIMHCMRINKY